MLSTQRRDRPRCGCRVRPCPHGCGGEHRLRADLQQHRAAEIGQCAHTFGELDRLPRMAAPVGAVQFRASAEGRAGAVAHQCPLRRTELEPVRIRLEFVEDRIQQRRMEGVAGVQPVTPHTVVGQPGNRLFHVLRGSGQHGVGAVVGGHRQTRELVGEALHPLGGGEDRGHPTAGGQTAEQAAALGQQQRAVLEAEHTRDAGRRVLADAVAQHHVGFEAPRLPEPGQAHLHREQGGLGIAGLPQGVFGIRASRSKITSSNGLSSTSATAAAHRVIVSANTGSVSNRLPGHAGVLAALPGEQPRRLRLVGALPPHQTRCRAIVGQRTE